MTRKRLATLVGGVVALCAISAWRLSSTAPSQVVDESESRPMAASEAPKTVLTTLVGTTMGTTFTVKYVAAGAASPERVENAVHEALESVVESMSTYVPSSEISQFNRAEAHTPQVLSEQFADVLQLALQVGAKTDGAFDPTVRPLVRAFGFGSKASETPPTNEELVAIRARVGMHLLNFAPESRTLSKTVSSVELDFGGIAKGYGVDRVTLALEAKGIANYMVEVGGEIRVRGEKALGTPWTLAIEEPISDAHALHATLRLSPTGGALATSGDYRNFRERDGEVISHTFDPRRGEPVARRTALVSVVRPSAAEADALATALGVLAPDTAIALANREGWAVYLLTHHQDGSFKPWKSRAFAALSFETLPPN